MFFAGSKMDTSSTTATIIKRAAPAIANGFLGCAWAAGFATEVEAFGIAIVDNCVVARGTPPTVLSKLPTAPGWIDEVVVPEPAEDPAD